MWGLLTGRGSSASLISGGCGAGEGMCGDLWGPGVREMGPKFCGHVVPGRSQSMGHAGRDRRELPCPQEKAGHSAQGRPPLSLCFQDCPAAEKESKVLRIVSRGLSGPQGWGGTGLRLDILPSIHQSSHVAGVCCNILSCCPEELLKQKAVLERVPLDDPSVSPDPSPLTSGPLKQPHVGSEI